MIIAVKSIGLSRSTEQAWNAAHVQIRRSTRLLNWIDENTEVINLGNSSWERLYGNREVSTQVRRIWNKPPVIRPLIYPEKTRNLLGYLMPPQENTGVVWIKPPGRAGRNKVQVTTSRELVLPENWDWCAHIEGTEYRIITVNDRIVQDFIREGENGNRSYTWVRMRDVPAEIKETARAAARVLGDYTIIAWDMIEAEDGTPYILEGNTSPGVNRETAKRIVKQMKKEDES